ncbi:MAG: PAS domain S-box protein [Spartobacteria bacterium]
MGIPPVSSSDDEHLLRLEIARHEETEQKLRESEERYRSLVAATTDVVWRTNAEGEIVHDIQSWEELTGQSAEEMHGSGWLAAIHPEDRAQVKELWERSTREQTLYKAQLRIRCADGQWREFVTTGVPIIVADKVREWVGVCVDVTERNRSERALRESELTQRAVLSSLTSHIAVLDTNGDIVAINAAWRRFGEENGASNLQGMGIGVNYLAICREAMAWNDRYARAALDGVHGVLARTAAEFRLEYPCDSPNEKRWFLMVVSPLEKSAGGAVVSHLDISKIKSAEALVADGKTVLEMIATGAPLEEILGTITGNLEKQSLGLFCSILLLDDDGIHLRHGAAPSLPLPFTRAIDDAVIGPVAGSCGTAVYRKERVIVADIATDPLWIDYAPLAMQYGLRACWSTPIQRENGEVLGSFAIYYTQPGRPKPEEMKRVDLATHLAEIAIVRKRTESALRSTNAQLSSLVRTTPLGIAVIDAQRVVQSWSPGAEQIFGWKASEVVGKILPTVPAGKEQEFEAHLRNGLAGEKITGKEVRRLHKDKTLIDLNLWTAPQMGEDGETTGVIAIFADISERKRAEESLHRANERFEFAVQATRDVVWDWDLTDDSIWWNENYRSLFGYALAASGVGSNSWFDHIHPEDVARVRASIFKIINGTTATWTDEYRFLRRDNAYAEIFDRGYVIRDRDGHAIRMIGAMMDMTPRKQMERNLTRSRLELRSLAARLRAVREDEATRIARELHDELGASLTGLKIDISTMERTFARMADPEEAAPFRERTGRALLMVDSMMESVRKICLELRPSVLDQLGLATAIEWQANEFETQAGIPCRVVRQHEVQVANETATAIFRVFQEILTNVRRHARASTVWVELSENDGQAVLEVRDDGRGLSQDASDDPKRLGIVGMRERAVAAGGSLTITSKPGAGTTVTFQAPLAGPVPQDEKGVGIRK